MWSTAGFQHHTALSLAPSWQPHNHHRARRHWCQQRHRVHVAVLPGRSERPFFLWNPLQTVKQNWPEGSNLKIYQIGINTQCESWKDTEWRTQWSFWASWRDGLPVLPRGRGERSWGAPQSLNTEKERPETSVSTHCPEKPVSIHAQLRITFCYLNF